MFTSQLYHFFSVFLNFALFSDEPEVFLPNSSKTAILHAAHFRRVVNKDTYTIEVIHFTFMIYLVS